MTLRVPKLLAVSSLLLLALFVLVHSAAAQQVTYYDFDGVTPNSACSASDSGGSLFCFNQAPTGTAGFPTLFQDTYPDFLNPDPNGEGTSTHYTLQLSDGSYTYSSAWFSVPQKVADGFTVYAAFRLAPVTSPPGDGIAFVIENAAGGPGNVDTSMTAADGQCAAPGGGLTAVGNYGACLGYGAIDNSIAIEFDPYTNAQQVPDSDPPVYVGADTIDGVPISGQHIAIKSCGLSDGVPLPNSPNHGQCNISPVIPNLTLADNQVHQVVIEYSGPPDYSWTLYLDPTFVSGTHTPVAGSIPLISTTADITTYMNLQNSGTDNDSAYVGFTGASGGAVENQEILAWTFTPHTPVVQQQTLQPPGPPDTYPTTFPFGDHTFGVNYESGDTGEGSIDMVNTAITISPTRYQSLVAGTAFAGTQCQVYDGTGGNCIVYSISCVEHGTSNVVPCPPSGDPSEPLIDVKTAYDNSIPPINPGLIQGDPFLAPIASISGDGTTATVTCAGECAVHNGQYVNILNPDFTTRVSHVLVSNSTISTFQFSSNITSGTGDYVNSVNLANIFISYNSQRIDGTSAGKTKNFSEIVALSLGPSSPAITSGNSTTFTAGSLASFPITTTGIPTPNISIGGASLAGTGLSFVDNGDGTGTISGTPTPVAPSGSPYSLTLTAHNATGPDFVQPFTLTINAANSQFSVTPLNLPFGTVNLGTSKSMAITVKNQGSSSITITKINFTYGPGSGKDYGYTTQCGGTLKAGKSCTITVTLKAQDLGSGSALLNIYFNQAGSPSVVSLSGTVINPKAKVSVSALSFGTVKVGQNSTKTVTLTSTGDTPLLINSITITGSGDFTLNPLNPCPASMAKNTTCTIGVMFAPSAKQSRSGTLKISDNASSSPQTVSLSGKGN